LATADGELAAFMPWRVAGSYFEACNCDAVCPCRQVGGRAGGRPTYGVCDFALSWRILDGHAGTTDLVDLMVVLAGRYDGDQSGLGGRWGVALYVDERGDERQREALTAIFLGRLGGTSLRNFAGAIGEVYSVRPARIALDHTPGRQRINAGVYVSVEGGEAVAADGPVACGIPGYDHPGQEQRASLMKVHEPPLEWELRGRCAFASDFDYRSDQD
jgi:hypothetical protein